MQFYTKIMTSIHANQWERLHSVISWAGMSTHAFACEIGLKRSENLYRIKNQKNGISRKLVSFIIKQYPEISDIWLMTGSGTMLRGDKLSGNNSIPYFQSDINQFLDAPTKYSAEYTFPCPTAAELAIDVSTNLIEHIIPSGSTAFLKQVDASNVIFGKPHYIVTEDYTEFCILVSDLSDTNYVFIKGVSFGNEAITRIAISEIKAIFKIVSYIRNM